MENLKDNKIENSESLLDNNKNNSKCSTKNEFIVKDYDDSCEEFSKIEKILSLRTNSLKYSLFILCSIITVGMVNLIVAWFPILKKYLIYSSCEVEKASHFGIFSVNHQFNIIKALDLILPDISQSHLKNHCEFNIVNNKIKLFEFRLYKYLYDHKEECFVSLKFSIKTTFENFHKYMTIGLNDDELIHQRSIFGKCDLEIKIDSVFKLLLIEISDPFYLFQVFSVTLWYCNNYISYSTIIVVTTLISIALAVYEIRINLLQIKKMARYNCNVNVFRKEKVD